MDFEQASKRARRGAATRRAIKQRELTLKRIDEIIETLKAQAAEDPEKVLEKLLSLEA